MKKQTSLFRKVFISSTTILLALSFIVIGLVYVLFPNAYTATTIEENQFYTDQLLQDARGVETSEEMSVLINAYEQFYGISTYIEDENQNGLLSSANFKQLAFENTEWYSENEGVINQQTEVGNVRYTVDRNIVPIGEKKFILYTTTELENTRHIMKPFVQMTPFIIIISLTQSLIVSYFLTRIIIKPISVLSKKAAAITNLDFDNKLSWNSEDEYGKLSMNLDEMQEKMKQVISHLEDDAYLRNQLALEEQQEKIAILSHELNTPLTVMKMQAELLINSESDEQKLVYLRRNLAKVDEITNLVDQILNYKFLEDTEVINVGEFVTDLLDTNYCKHNIELTIESELEVEISHLYLSRILVNLINNAEKYNYKNKKIEIFIDDKSFRISNYHHPDYILEKKEIFRPYVRGTNDQKITGQGLGLYICKRICALNHFVLDVDSTDQIFSAVIIFKINGDYLEGLI